MRDLHEYLSRDHQRLDELLLRALDNEGAYIEFRRGLLRHIGIEERVLFPFLKQHFGSTVVEKQLHRDHAALSALLVPPPGRREIEQIRSILTAHNPLEEDEGGMYDRLERLAADALAGLLTVVTAFPQVPVAPHSDTPLLRRTIEQLIRDAAEGRRHMGT